MLFSKENVAQVINAIFEPVWESLRPVPIVRIDFGNGTVLTRTLHGNILTSVCDADCNLLDALSGIYTEKAYLHQLEQLNSRCWAAARSVALRRHLLDHLRARHWQACFF